MSGPDGLAGAVVRVMRTRDALDYIQDLHVHALGVSGEGGQAARVAFVDLSDAVCAALGQLAATDASAGDTILASAVAAAKRRGVDGVESILLSAFLSAMHEGITGPAGDAASIWRRQPFPGRLAGGALRVPLMDSGRLTVGSVSAAELIQATSMSGGSAVDLAERLQRLVGEAGPEDEALEIDDPTLGPVALACADGFVATVTAARIGEAQELDSALAAQLDGVLDPTAVWRGPLDQLQLGKTLALAVGVVGAGAAELPDAGPLPAGLMPRPRSSDPASVTPAGPAGARSRVIPARVTEVLPTWLSMKRRSAELNPPRDLRPLEASPGTGAVLARGRTRTSRGDLGRVPSGVNRKTLPAWMTEHPSVAGPPSVVDPLTGELVNPFTGQPTHPTPNPSAEFAEAVMAEAQQLGIDVTTATVEECANAFLDAGR